MLVSVVTEATRILRAVSTWLPLIRHPVLSAADMHSTYQARFTIDSLHRGTHAVLIRFEVQGVRGELEVNAGLKTYLG